MYEEYFNFSGQPFKLNPDPKFFFGSRSHNKAMAYLHYGLRQAEGFIVITGEIGAGKSMLIGHLLDQLDRSRIAAAHLLTPNLKPEDLLSHILSAFRVEPAGEGKTAELDAFEDYLFDQLNHGRRVLLIVDEAQNLPPKTLEELRVLSNMDYDGTPLFQVFLVGQPEFRPALAAPDMEQLRQRIIASYHLEPLSAAETRDYVLHRLTVVGWSDDPAFAEDAFEAIHKATGGVPRKINKLCNRLMLFCALEQRHAVDGSLVTTVIADLRQENMAQEFELAEEDFVASRSTDQASDKRATYEAARGEADADAAAGASGAANGLADHFDVESDDAPPSLRPVSDDGLENEAPADMLVAADPAHEKLPVADPMTDQAPAIEFAALPVADVTDDVEAEDEDGARTDQLDSAAKPTTSDDISPGREVALPAAQAVAVAPAALNAPDKTEGGEPMSVLDRLRLKKAERARELAAGPAAASLDEVAKAVAAAAVTTPSSLLTASQVGSEDRKPRLAFDAGATEAGAIDVPGFDDAGADTPEDIANASATAFDPSDWRRSVVRSINETRTELKRAHANMAWLRKQVHEADRARVERKSNIEASLSRAEQILAELRSHWK